jgi:hypothetical protein
VEKKKSVDDQFAVKYKSETYGWTQKINRDPSTADNIQHFRSL